MNEIVNNTPSDVSREGVSLKKMLHLFRLLFQHTSTKVLMYGKTFSQIHFDELYKKGIRGIILDVDDCIAPHHGDILPENIALIEKLLKDFRIVIFSNMKKNNRYKQLEDKGVTVITSEFGKPDKRGFEKCLEVLQLLPVQVACIGDNYITDGGSKDVGIGFVKVMPLRTDKNRNINRKVQIAIQSLVDTIAKTRGHLPYY